MFMCWNNKLQSTWQTCTRLTYLCIYVCLPYVYVPWFVCLCISFCLMQFLHICVSVCFCLLCCEPFYFISVIPIFSCCSSVQLLDSVGYKLTSGHRMAEDGCPIPSAYLYISFTSIDVVLNNMFNCFSIIMPNYARTMSYAINITNFNTGINNLFVESYH